MSHYTRLDKILSDALLELWWQMERRGDEPAAEKVKQALDRLGLPWVPIRGSAEGSTR